MRHRILWGWFGAIFCSLALWLVVPVLFSTLTMGDASLALAADDEPASAADNEPASAAEDELAPAAEDEDELEAKPAGESIVPEEEEAEKSGVEKSKRSTESFLVWLYQSLRVRYVIIFLIITFNSVALIVMIVLGLRRNALCPDDLAAVFEAKLNEKKYQEAYELVKGEKSLLGKVLAAGMAKLPDSYPEALEAMQEVGEEQNMRMEQRNGYIALIAQIGPMFGLLGTVDGMVMAFDVIANSNVTPKPSELAAGIGTALVTTIVGLWVAIPLMVFYHIVRNRLTRFMMEVGAVSGELMERFETVQISLDKG